MDMVNESTAISPSMFNELITCLLSEDTCQTGIVMMIVNKE